MTTSQSETAPVSPFLSTLPAPPPDFASDAAADEVVPLCHSYEDGVTCGLCANCRAEFDRQLARYESTPETVRRLDRMTSEERDDALRDAGRITADCMDVGTYARGGR